MSRPFSVLPLRRGGPLGVVPVQAGEAAGRQAELLAPWTHLAWCAGGSQDHSQSSRWHRAVNWGSRGVGAGCVGLAGAAEVLHEKPLQQRMVLGTAGLRCMLCPPEIQRIPPRELQGARQIARIQ